MVYLAVLYLQNKNQLQGTTEPAVPGDCSSGRILYLGPVSRWCVSVTGVSKSSFLPVPTIPWNFCGRTAVVLKLSLLKWNFLFWCCNSSLLFFLYWVRIQIKRRWKVDRTWPGSQ